ncbi:TPA: hypothetical protein J1V58_004831, partial [Escherichia coli]|nr:hypothetical protein [Escherichia coli]
VKKIKVLLSEKDSSLDDNSITKSLEIMLKETKFAGSPEGIHFYNTPNYLIANSAFRAGEYNECVEYATKHLANGKSLETEVLILRSYIHLDNDSEIQKSIERITSYHKMNDGEVGKLVNGLVDLMDAKKFKIANSLMDILESRTIPSKHKQLLLINRVLCNKLQKQPLSAKQQQELEEVLNEVIDKNEAWLALGAAILLEKWDIAEEVLSALDETEIVTILTQSMPIFDLISTEFYEKVKLVAIERGYNVSFEEETELPEVVPAEDETQSLSPDVREIPTDKKKAITHKSADNDEAFDGLRTGEESISKPA